MARWGLVGIVYRFADPKFPWGTLAVNASGCLLAGIVWSLATPRINISGEIRAIILVGFMGAFTTFSTFMVETGNLMRESHWWAAAGNVAMQNVLGLGMFFAGLSLGRLA